MNWFDWLPGFTDPRIEQLQKKLQMLSTTISSFTLEENQVVAEIQRETRRHNLNNITRTMAYWSIYQRNPELHWALLAHMVSRNAGWNMTDLKGDWLSRILTKQEAASIFLFMERANWLIFQDAYPQLLLYEKSKQREKALFHLLPGFHVSRFMQVLWQDYWEQQNQEDLTIALVINEQHYIESRVIEQEAYAAPVLKDIKFYLEDWLDLNMILFPVWTDRKIELYGKQVNSFPDLQKRIALGKHLYSLLFSPEVLPGVLAWCRQTPHSGSREDYWPHFFSSSTKENLRKPYANRWNGKQIGQGVLPVYSPKLKEVWPNHSHEPAMIGDWLESPKAIQQLQSEKSKAARVNEEYEELVWKINKMVETKEEWIGT